MRDKVLSIRLSEAEVAYVYQMGGSDYVRKVLAEDKARRTMRQVQDNPHAAAGAVEQALNELLPELIPQIRDAVLTQLSRTQMEAPNLMASALLAHAQQFFPPERVQQAQEGVHGV